MTRDEAGSRLQWPFVLGTNRLVGFPQLLTVSKTHGRQGARTIDHVVRTPVIQSQALNKELGAQVFFKCENQQHVGAFKSRGACNAVFSLTEDEAAAGVVAHSSGNHAAALARAAQLRGIASHIVMPHDAAAVKIDAVRGYGVEPTFCEPDSDSRQAAADKVIDPGRL